MRGYEIVYAWCRVSVSLVYCFNITIADAELESSVFLWDQYHRCGLLRSCGHDDILGDHLINLGHFKLARF